MLVPVLRKLNPPHARTELKAKSHFPKVRAMETYEEYSYARTLQMGAEDRSAVLVCVLLFLISLRWVVTVNFLSSVKLFAFCLYSSCVRKTTALLCRFLLW
jgi:hypothetical protein